MNFKTLINGYKYLYLNPQPHAIKICNKGTVQMQLINPSSSMTPGINNAITSDVTELEDLQFPLLPARKSQTYEQAREGWKLQGKD